MKILLTGSNGFIGKNIKLHLQDKYELFCPDRTQLNLFDTAAVKNFLRIEQFDLVIHAANVNGSRKIHATPYEILWGNILMFYNLVSCKESFGKMIYLGSGAEFDSSQYIPFMKEDYFGINIPQDAYGLSKYVMAKESEKTNNIYEFRLFGVFGPYEEWEHRFISYAICRTLKDLPIVVNQNVFFDYIWVEDLIDIIEIMMHKTLSYKQYNLCRGEKIDLLSLAHLVQEICNRELPIIVQTSGLKKEYTGCNQRLMDEIGGYKFTSYETAIIKLVDFYKGKMDEIHF